MKIYTLRVSIIGIPKLYRIIELSDTSTFDDLHDVIFEAFHRYDSHLYSFFITKKDTQDMRIIWKAPEITHPQNTMDVVWEEKKEKVAANEICIGQVGLEEKDVFQYLFDFGDDWWHRIRVQSIKEKKIKGRHIKIVKSVGDSPPQYPEYDEDDDE